MSGTGPLLDPPALKRLPPFESGAGREAVRLVEVPRERWDWGWEANPLSWGADEYEAVVDAERGVLLRTASRLGGKDYDALEVEKIHFDERFPRMPSLREIPYRGASRSHPQVVTFGEPPAGEVRRILLLRTLVNSVG
jgi:hypothetical protein